MMKNFIIMSSPKKATGKESKRKIHIAQHQLKQESRRDAENNQSSREEDKKEGHSIQDGKNMETGDRFSPRSTKAQRNEQKKGET